MVRAPPPAMRPPLGWPTRTPVKRQRATAEALTRGSLKLSSDHLKVYRSARNAGGGAGIVAGGSGLGYEAIFTTKLTQMRWRHLCWLKQVEIWMSPHRKEGCGDDLRLAAP